MDPALGAVLKSAPDFWSLRTACQMSRSAYKANPTSENGGWSHQIWQKKKYGKWGFKPPEGVFPTCSNKPLQLGTASRSHERRCWRSSLTILLMGEVPQDWVEKILGKCCGSENHSEYHQLKLSHLTIVKLSHLTIVKLSHHYFDICQAKSFNHSEYRYLTDMSIN